MSNHKIDKDLKTRHVRLHQRSVDQLTRSMIAKNGATLAPRYHPLSFAPKTNKPIVKHLILGTPSHPKGHHKTRRFSTYCVALFTGLTLAGQAHAGFLNDFYEEAGAQAAYTPAGIYATSSMNTMMGGRYVLKVPRQDFQPFYMSAPHLKAGCGGIDFFLGGFSIPSKDEFLDFARSIGTALPGLAFHLALQSLAPDLNEQVSQFRDMLMRISNMMGDSCQMAENIMSASGAESWINNMGHRARNALRADGTAEDASDALLMTKTDGGKVLSSVPERVDEKGNVLEAAEINLTWALLSNGRMNAKMSKEMRETMMSLVGTTVFRTEGSGADTTTVNYNYAPLDLLQTMLGDETSDRPSKDAQIYSCDESKKCLNITKKQADDINLAHVINKALVDYRESIVTRDPNKVTNDQLVMLATISSLPLLRIGELAASPRVLSFSDSMLSTLSQVAAYEAILTAVAQLANDVDQAINSSTGKNVNQHALEHAKAISARLAFLRNELRNCEEVIALRMQRVTSLMSQFEHYNRTIYGDAAVDALNTLPGGGLSN